MSSMRSHGVDAGVHVPDRDARVLQIGRQVLGHFFGQGGDQHPLLPGGHACGSPADEIVDLPLDGADDRPPGPAGRWGG